MLQSAPTVRSRDRDMARIPPPAHRAARLGMLAVALLITIVGSAAGPVAPASASVICGASSPAPTEGGVDMTATILGPATDPCAPPPTSNGSGSTGSTGSPTTSGSRGGSGGASTGASSAVETATEKPAPQQGDIDLGGVVHVGGLTSTYLPSLNPFGGEIALAFVVRNVSQTTFDSSARFWMENPFGGRVAESVVDISALKPGESRVVSMRLPGAGQWTVLTAHATFTPPETVEDTALSPLTRDATVFALPWFLLLLIVLGVVTAVIVTVVRRSIVVRDEPIGAFS